MYTYLHTPALHDALPIWSLKIDRAGRDRNPRAGSTRIAVCADDICGHGDPRQIISRRLCVGVSLGGLDGPPDAADYVELVRDADSGIERGLRAGRRANTEIGGFSYRSEEHTYELQSQM